MNEEPSKSSGNGLRDLGVAMAIPTLLVSGPLVGYFIGSFLDRKFDWDPWAKVVLMVLGMISSFRECMTMLRRINRKK
jgi:F0F1-type ATP synthase assembly protein I